MRIVCFVLGVLCLLGAGGMVLLGTLNLDGGGSSSPATSSSNFRMQESVYDEPNLDDFGPATTLAGVFTLAGIAWMIGAVAFAPKQAAPAAVAPPQWQPQYAPPQQSHQGGQYPPSTPFPQQPHGQQQGQPPQQQ